jgi:hypothetical protein
MVFVQEFWIYDDDLAFVMPRHSLPTVPIPELPGTSSDTAQASLRRDEIEEHAFVFKRQVG